MPVLYVSKSPFVVIDSSITAITGPIEHSAISPKLFSLEFLPPIVVEIPTPSAIINGTVIGPVVTPPESKESGKSVDLPISGEAIIAQTANSIK